MFTDTYRSYVHDSKHKRIFEFCYVILIFPF
jgi:hypothetical protein